MIKAFVLLTLVICFFLHLAYCKIGLAADTLQTATLKCLISQDMTNFLYGTKFPPQ